MTEHISCFLFVTLYGASNPKVSYRQTRPIYNYAWNRNSHDPFKGHLRVLGIITGYPKFQLHRRSMNPLENPEKKCIYNWTYKLDVLYFRGTLSFQISNKKGLGLRVVMAVILQQWQTRIREELLPAKQHCQENLRAAKVAATAPKIGQDIPKPATASRKAISEGQKGNVNLPIFKHSIPEVWLIFEDSPYHISFGAHISWHHVIIHLHPRICDTSKRIGNMITEVSLDEGLLNLLVSKHILTPQFMIQI